KVLCVPNSFDRNECSGDESIPQVLQKSDRMVLASVGSMASPGPRISQSEHRKWKARLRHFVRNAGAYVPSPWDPWALSPWYVLQALKLIASSEPDIGNHIELRIAGHLANSEVNSAKLQQLIDEMGLSRSVHWLGHVARTESLRLIQGADVLVLQSQVPKNGARCPIVPARTYEYLCAGKPILALLPSGDAADIVHESGVGTFAQPDNCADIASKILKLFRQHVNGGIPATPNHSLLERFRSDRLADQMLEVFKAAIAGLQA
ncbi:MAG: glycosyltransferase, partial [Thermoguttaceae bacterium]|nr:glycosyltransferase [Thermoguttaceae bacterium]